jgi:hypothetical protein
MGTRHLHDFGGFGFSYFKGKYTGNADALLMHVHHNAKRIFLTVMKYFREDNHNKFHGRVIIIVQKHPEKLWSRDQATGGGRNFFLSGRVYAGIVNGLCHTAIL